MYVQMTMFLLGKIRDYNQSFQNFLSVTTNSIEADSKTPNNLYLGGTVFATATFRQYVENVQKFCQLGLK